MTDLPKTYFAKRLLETREDFAEILNYDPETGILTWKVDRYQSVKAGQVAGSLGDGYVRIKTGGRRYFAHRIAWVMVYGRPPKGDIDHINRIRSDNRLVNLRDVSRSENQQNTLARPTNTSGFKGVRRPKGRNKWLATIVVGGRSVHVGSFNSPAEAAEAYAQAAAKHHKFNPLAAT